MVIIVAFVQSIGPVENRNERVETVREFMRLLSDDMFPIDLKDKQRQKSWKDEKITIIRMILFNDDAKNLPYMEPGWKERLRNIKNLQKQYGYNVEENLWSRQSSISSVANNRFATEADIDHVLRFHRPLTIEETTAIKVEEESFGRSSTTTDIEYIDTDYHNAREREYYRPLLKKYYVIDPELIHKLVEIRYDLMKKSLMGKRMSDLRKLEDQFYEERLLALVDSWYRNKKLKDSRGIDNFLLVNSDREYRKSLNCLGHFFKGNVIYGYKNRYDDPTVNGLGFEKTASRIMGQNYKQFKELHDLIINLDIKSKDYSQFRHEHFQSIIYCLDHFKTWTFWFPQKRFKANLWSPSVSASRRESFAIKPKNFESKKLEDMRTAIDRDLNKVKEAATRDPMIDTEFLNSEHFKEKLWTIYINLKNIKNKMPVAVNPENIIYKMLKHHMDLKQIKDSKSILSSLDSIRLGLFTNLPENSRKPYEFQEYNGLGKSKLEDNMNAEMDRIANKVKDLFDGTSNTFGSDGKNSKPNDGSTDLLAGPSGIDHNKFYFGNGGDHNEALFHNVDSKITNDGRSGKKNKTPKHY